MEIPFRASSKEGQGYCAYTCEGRGGTSEVKGETRRRETIDLVWPIMDEKYVEILKFYFLTITLSNNFFNLKY